MPGYAEKLKQTPETRTAAPAGPAYQLLALLAVLGLFLPFLGPVVDHHFAERHPAHQHLYLGAAVPEHQHLYQAAHRHHHPINHQPGNHQPSNHRAGDYRAGDYRSGSPTAPAVAFLAPADGGVPVAADIVSAAAWPPLLFGGDDGARPGFGDAPTDVLQGVGRPPPLRPPAA